MIIYSMKCPIHKIMMDTTKLIQRNESAKKEPIFKCDLCQRYYLRDAGSEGRKIGTYGKIDVMSTQESYSIRKDSPNSSIGGTIWKGGGTKSGGNSTGGITPPKPGKSADITVRIKNIKDSETAKAKQNLSNIRNEYPSVATDKMSVLDFIKKVCGANITKTCIVRNTSLMWKNSLVKKVEFYVTDAVYLKNKLPSNVYISFGGKVSNGEFIVDEIRVLENPVIKDGWQTQPLIFAYDGPKHGNWFYNITEKPAEPSKKLTGEIASWNAYLDWKRQLAELRIKGIKYIAVRFDLEEQKMVFLTVTEGKTQLKEFRKFLNRNEISVFSNKYSKNRWEFEFNREYQGAQDSGVDVVFIGYGEQFVNDSAVRGSSWGSINSGTKKYKEDKDQLSFAEKLGGIGRTYFEPCYQELVFELTDRAITLVKRDLRRNGSVSERTEDTIAEEFYGDGYIATSQIGDFALLSRLQRAIDDLANGKAAQQALNQWLFDIKRASNTSNLEKITNWQNDHINEKQKIAVEKIISTPEICLIQGPPGTGKTTVIAEAIYQLVIRNKRVLVASQANLAVDNALERLISNPKIRAIRLGNAKKIDDSVKNITEDNVLETFYDSIVTYIQEKFLDKWEEMDEISSEADADYEHYERLVKTEEKLKKSVSSKRDEIQKMKLEAEAEERFLQRNAIASEKNSMLAITAFCNGTVNEIEPIFSEKCIIDLWTQIEPVLLDLNDKGLILTKKVGINTANLGSVLKRQQANRIIKHVLINAKRAINLSEKINRDGWLNGDAEELENLKILELELRNKMLTNQEVFAEWQETNKKIQELSSAGLGFTSEEEELFAQMDSVADDQKKPLMTDVLENTLEQLADLLETIKDFSVKAVADINEKIAALDDEDEKLIHRIEEESNSIIDLQANIIETKRRQTIILNKYDAKPENLQEQIDLHKTSHISELKTSLPRTKWEGIFSGLREWVSEIPDYSQEKDIFLKEFINGCNVVGVSCTENTRTLTENGFDDFDVVIIDEVSKATPPELLIPMLRGRKIVLVGDHRQLPPLFNEHEKSYEEVAKQQEEMDDMIVPLTMEDFEKYKDMVTASLFERYFENAHNSIKETLTIQYRMHSDIMDLINIFYDGYLRDGNEDEYTEETKAHYLNIFSTFGTEMIIPERHAYWFDSSQLAGERIFEQRKAQSSSCENLVEAETIIELLKKMEVQYANLRISPEPINVGVISFYYDQVSLIRKMLKAESFHAIDVEVNTVDRFQGKEKEIIFVSLVRNVKNPRFNIDSYIAAFQRINVAFSRAQNLLIILGATDMYAEQPVRITDMNNGEGKVIYPYKQILEIMNTRGTYFTCDEVIPETRVDEILLNIERQGESEE